MCDSFNTIFFHKMASNRAHSSKGREERSGSSSKQDEKSGISERSYVLLKQYFGHTDFKTRLQGEAVENILKSMSASEKL